MVRGVIADNLLESVGRMVVAGFVLCRVSGQKVRNREGGVVQYLCKNCATLVRCMTEVP